MVKMKNLFSYLFLTFILLTVSNSLTAQTNKHEQTKSSEIFYDFFPGTIVQENNELYLHSCQTFDAKFKLSFNHQKDKRRVLELLQQHPQFWVHLTASATEDNGQYLMDVEGIYEEYPNQTCHLMELLEQISDEQAQNKI